MILYFTIEDLSKHYLRKKFQTLETVDQHKKTAAMELPIIGSLHSLKVASITQKST